MSNKNPRKWRFTWEAQSHSPTLKLFVFDSHTTPSIQCHNLQVSLDLSRSLVSISWTQQPDSPKRFSLAVPLPRALVDPESPLSHQALADHIEVKLLLLLPVDHPIVSSLNSLAEDREIADDDVATPLVMDSDLENLSSSKEEGVDFYCRCCWTKLTRRPIRSSNLSKDVNWIEFLCPQCSSLLGAYPCVNGIAPIDGGVRLFKCYVSTYLPVGGSNDMFRNYTLERMFTHQLLESAKDELSFRTVVRDLKTKSPMVQIFLLNPNSWSCTGYCLDSDSSVGSISKLDLHPIIKVLFSDCSNNSESELRTLEDWLTKNLADEVFMLACQIEELIEVLASAKAILPPSCSSSIQGLPLSSLRR